mgnify:CR=1 FL=1
MPTEKKNHEDKNKFWNFIPGTATTAPELLLYGAISSTQSWWQDRVTPAQFNKELAELGDVSEIVVRINSGGGDVFAANAIYTRLKDHPADITVKVDGWAASAATIIAMAGDTIKIARNGVFMIHDPSMTVWDSFTAEDFEKMAEELKVIKQSIVNTYAMKTKKDASEIENLMSKETWWTGEDAVSNGFCDQLLFEDANTVVENTARIVVNSIPLDLSAYKTMPNMQKIVLNGPKNPGSLQINHMPKEEKQMAEAHNNVITTAEQLENAYPDLVQRIKADAAAAERQRIKEIKDLSGGRYKNIIEDAMFKNPITAEKVAMKIVMAQKEQGSNFLNNRNKDAEDSNAAEVGSDAGEQEIENIFDAAIDELYPE